MIIAAENKEQAESIASKTLLHTKEFTVKEIILDAPKVIIYNSGDY